MTLAEVAAGVAVQCIIPGFLRVEYGLRVYSCNDHRRELLYRK